MSCSLSRSAALLMEESGLHLEHPAAATFRTHVLAGDWVKADHDLRALHDLLRESPHVDAHTLAVSELSTYHYPASCTLLKSNFVIFAFCSVSDEFFF